MEAHDAPYWPAAWTEPQSTSTSTILGLRCASFRSARQAACWQINGRDKVAVVGRCSPRPRPSADPDMAARLRRLQLQLQFQLRLQLEYGSFRANDIKKHIMAPLWKVVVVVALCLECDSGKKPKGAALQTAVALLSASSNLQPIPPISQNFQHNVKSQ